MGVFVANFGSMEVSKGTTWGVDDGVEVSVAGKPRRAFADGRKKWVYEVAIPFAELGVSPKAGVKLPFNVRVRNSQYGEWRQWDADDRTPQLLLQ